jgi:hypothetical protein
MAKKKPKTPGARNKISRRNMLRLVDADTGELIAIIRWRPHGEVFVEHAKHVRPKVTADHKA